MNALLTQLDALRRFPNVMILTTTNITEAIAHANGAAMLAAQAQQLANNDVQSAQRVYMNRTGGGGGNMRTCNLTSAASFRRIAEPPPTQPLRCRSEMSTISAAAYGASTPGH